jgi:hypothetical protein
VTDYLDKDARSIHLHWIIARNCDTVFILPDGDVPKRPQTRKPHGEKQSLAFENVD